MAYPIEKKLVVAVASSALFDLTDSHAVFEQQGPSAYKKFQEQHIDSILKPGVAFPFVKRFLSINKKFPELLPVEVVLLSRNSAVTGRRVFRSIEHHELAISRAAFTEGKSPYPYIPAFNASLFLSSFEDDVRMAVAAGYPGGLVLPGVVVEDDENELRLAFDYDGVIVDDESETVYQREHSVEEFQDYETEKSHIPHNPGLLADFFAKLSLLQKLEDAELEKDRNYERVIRTAIVTARQAPTNERVVTTLEDWGVGANEVFFLGGMPKDRILSVLKPHMFFDDQKAHLASAGGDIPMVHIPFGIANVSQKPIIKS